MGRGTTILYIATMLFIPTHFQEPPRVVQIDAGAKDVPFDRHFEACVGSDRAAIYLGKEHQEQLRQVHRELGFRMTRCHGLFNEEMGVVRPDGSYDWTKVDAYLDAVKKAGMRPFIETGFMPEPLASGRQTIFYYKGNTTPPKSYDAWAALLTAFVRHAQARYGKAEVRRWPFEIWNEPNLEGFWHGTQAEYFRLYETSARALKAADPAIRVGGPATAGGGWIPEFLAFCASRKVPVDFVTTHGYGVGQGFLDENGNQGQVLDSSPDALVGQFRGNAQQIRASAFPGLPLYVTEWGPSYSAHDPVHDAYLAAPYLLEKLAQTGRDAAIMSYWAFSDLFEENGPPPSPFHGGFGLLNVQGLKKPAYFAYRFLHELKGDALSTGDPRALAARDGRTLRLLAWDYTEPRLAESNQIHFKRDLPSAPVRPLRLVLSGLRLGEATVTITRVGYRKNDVYTAYLDLGSPRGQGPNLPPDVITKLRAASNGRPESRQRLRVHPDGTLAVEVAMRENDVVWVEIAP